MFDSHIPTAEELAEEESEPKVIAADEIASETKSKGSSLSSPKQQKEAPSSIAPDKTDVHSSSLEEKVKILDNQLEEMRDREKIRDMESEKDRLKISWLEKKVEYLLTKLDSCKDQKTPPPYDRTNTYPKNEMDGANEMDIPFCPSDTAAEKTSGEFILMTDLPGVFRFDKLPEIKRFDFLKTEMGIILSSDKLATTPIEVVDDDVLMSPIASVSPTEPLVSTLAIEAAILTDCDKIKNFQKKYSNDGTPLELFSTWEISQGWHPIVKMEMEGNDDRITVNSVRIKMWEASHVMMPINHNNMHWYLLVLNNLKKTIVLIDSHYRRPLVKYGTKLRKFAEFLPYLYHSFGAPNAFEEPPWSIIQYKDTLCL